ncbi:MULTISPECIES: GNAT family N-acetyltransferase [unclassified Curtobacterium]|uniref:GNAT family N-acetyltransferase n=1 Tax=unclassified Curtobacterium TaxID=257496 RepID=UPI00278A9CBC|nr:GNAT family N-acetyltransferase [Curtobacterium sp. 260]MDP9737373.1 putative acetyltransferase [Curtobacterium sp. 260]
MFELVRPRAELFQERSEARREWGPGLHEDGFGITSDDEVNTVDGFRDWVARIEHGPTELWWIVEDGEVLGGIALRAADDERVQSVGHIGYGIRPSARGRGVATWALGEVLLRAASLGIDPVVAFCLEDNAGSVATLERHGATLEAVEQHGAARVRRSAIRSGVRFAHRSTVGTGYS